jgi:hypothetical protein
MISRKRLPPALAEAEAQMPRRNRDRLLRPPAPPKYLQRAAAGGVLQLMAAAMRR